MEEEVSQGECTILRTDGCIRCKQHIAIPHARYRCRFVQICLFQYRARITESATYVCRRTSRPRITRYTPGDRAIRAIEEKRSGSSLTSIAAKESVSVRAECNAESTTTEGGCRDPSIGEGVTAGGAPPENDNQRRRRKLAYVTMIWTTLS